MTVSGFDNSAWDRCQMIRSRDFETIERNRRIKAIRR